MQFIFDILAIGFGHVLHNYFANSIKLFSDLYLVKFSTSAKSFFPCTYFPCIIRRGEC